MANSANTVVVGVDGTEGSAGPLRYAVREATRLGAGLKVVHVTPGYLPMATAMPYLPGEIAETGRAIVSEARNTAALLAPNLAISTAVVSGSRILELVEAARDARILVVGRETRGTLDRLVSGSTTSPVATRAAVPVIAVPGDWSPPAEGGRLVVGLKSPADSTELLEAAFRRAAETGASLEVVHAWKLPGIYADLIEDRTHADDWLREGRRLVEDELKQWRAAYPSVRVNARVVHDDPGRALVRVARGADLVLLRRRSLRLLGGHLGATARAVLGAASCPVMIVPSVPAGRPPVDLELERSGALLR